jgi:hypothetical protein
VDSSFIEFLLFLRLFNRIRTLSNADLVVSCSAFLVKIL